MGKNLGILLAVEREGKMRRVVTDRPRHELQIAAWWEQHYRTYWDVRLDNGEELTVYRDRMKACAWFEV